MPPSGIRALYPSKRAAADPRFRPRGFVNVRCNKLKFVFDRCTQNYRLFKNFVERLLVGGDEIWGRASGMQMARLSHCAHA